MAKRTWLERIEDRIDRASEAPCWRWLGRPDRHGYGQFGVTTNGKTVVYRAHRVVYELLVAPIPEGLELDHLCRNRICVNPAHLEAVTHAENVRRGRAGEPQRARTHCKRGHPYDEENTYTFRGRRQCRACQRIRDALRRQRR